LPTYLPKPTQISGARFLAQRKYALLADEPRCGKTGTAVMATDMVLAERVLVITTASGRGVWVKGFQDWSYAGRRTLVIDQKNVKLVPEADTVIVGWPSISKPQIRSALLRQSWSVLVSDEDHNAKNYTAQRTQALYGTLVNDGAQLNISAALFSKAERVWPLTGTPVPHSPFDTYPRLRALLPERLKANLERGWPDVTRQNDFMHRYCIVRMKQISNFNRIPVVVGSRNLDELRERLAGFSLLRTQQDVGIAAPIYETLPLCVSEKELRETQRDLPIAEVLQAAASGSTRDLEMHLGPLRRLTGEIKAKAVVEAVHDEMAGGLDKIVLFYWHRDVGDLLQQALAKLGVIRLDGATTDKERRVIEGRWRTGPERVFLGQIQAACEAIDLSTAAVLWFIEQSFTPAQMVQASYRITNFEQKRQAFVKVVTLQGSIDEAIQSRLMTLWTGIQETLRK
jgi:SWI/SNF-related matrix-associated actin-dependent regulator of chromatin subfamily A-like protein 1